MRPLTIAVGSMMPMVTPSEKPPASAMASADIAASAQTSTLPWLTSTSVVTLAALFAEFAPI